MVPLTLYLKKFLKQLLEVRYLPFVPKGYLIICLLFGQGSRDQSHVVAHCGYDCVGGGTSIVCNLKGTLYWALCVCDGKSSTHVGKFKLSVESSCSGHSTILSCTPCVSACGLTGLCIGQHSCEVVYMYYSNLVKVWHITCCVIGPPNIY